MYVYNGYGTAFDGASSWSLAIYFPRNLIFGNFPRNVIFGVNKCLSSHTGNRENNSLVLGEGSTTILIVVLVLQRKRLVLILVKERQTFYLSLHYNCENSYLFVNRKISVTLKLIIKMPTFLFSVVQKAYPKNLTVLNLRKCHLFHEFSVDCNAFDIPDLNVHKYLMVKNVLSKSLLHYWVLTAK